MSSIIPEAFIPFLDALTFTPPQVAATPLIKLRGERTCQTADESRHISEAVSLYLRQETKVKAPGVRQKILHQLRENNHAANDQIADAFLGCIVAAASSGQERAVFWADALLNFERSDVSHFFVLPNTAITPKVAFDGYSIGPINIDVLKSRCRRARCDYATLYAARLEGRVALQSPEFAHTVINFIKLSLDQGFLFKKSWRNVMLHYFECISHQHLDFMWAHLARTQVLAAPFGNQIMDTNSLRGDMGKFAENVTIYLEISTKGFGYVVPEVGALILNQPGLNSEAYQRFQNHRETYRLSEIGESELGRVIYECGGFCQQALKFLESGRADDAALYATICLEHIFSEKQSTSEAVCSRAAVLTYPRLTDDYHDSLIEMKKLYDARSGFVHAGKSVPIAQAERLIDYSREVLRSLLLLHMKPDNRAPGFLRKWIKDLDFVIAGIESGKTWDNAFLGEIGIVR